MNFDIVAADRAQGLKGGLHRFIRMSWHVLHPSRPFVDNWHIGAVSEHCEALYRRQIRKLVVNEPPGCMKSLGINVFFPVWCWILDPSYKTISAAYDAKLVGKRDGGQVIKLIHSDWFRARWGDRVRVSLDASAFDFETNAGGWRFATSVRGGMTGRHANGLAIDDPHKAQDLSDNALDSVEEWFRSTADSRVLPEGWRALIMQRLHMKDLAGRLLAEGGWEHLMLPMRFDPKRVCVTSIGFRDPRTEHGQLLWPAYKTETEVLEREKTMGSAATSAQYQQSPTVAGGLVFKLPWFNYYTVAPARFDAMCMSFDFTFKDVGKNKGDVDYVAAGVYGRKSADYYALDLHVQRLDFPGSLALVRRLSVRWPRVIAKLVEDKANGPAVISMLKKEVSGLIAVTPEGGKEARANAVAPLYEAGNVWYPDPEGAIIDVAKDITTKTPFMFEGKPASVQFHVDNMTGFPFAAHDDDVDCETQALLHMRNKAGRFLEAMKALQQMGLR